MLGWDAFLSLPVPADPYCPRPREENGQREARTQHPLPLAAHPAATTLPSNPGIHCLGFLSFPQTSQMAGQGSGIEWSRGKDGTIYLRVYWLPQSSQPAEGLLSVTPQPLRRASGDH